jgi:FKBP-type peptidyl-prolyl cis-trans isomerase
MKSRFALILFKSPLACSPSCPLQQGRRYITGPSTLQITDTTVGTGALAETGDTVTVHYIGAFLDGTVFDSSYNRGTPYTFQLGAGQVIRGFDQGVVGMRVGGKRHLVIPSSLAYGSQGSGSIPPNTPIQFQVELVSIAGK